MLPPSEIEKAFDLDDQLRNVDAIFGRVFVGTESGWRLKEDAESVRDVEALRIRSAGTHDRRGAALDGLHGVGDVRQGKYFELELDAASAEQARSIASDVADKLLANPVIESYRVEVE